MGSLETHECILTIIESGVGSLRESDIAKCRSSEPKDGRAHALLFNTEPNEAARAEAERLGVRICTFHVIYDLMDHLKDIVSEAVRPVERLDLTGSGEVLKVFKIYSKERDNTICGVRVTSGTIKSSDVIEVYRGTECIHTGKSLVGAVSVYSIIP